MTRAAGIDVSRWQTSTPDLSGLDFLIARVAYGTALDASYPKHIANARRAGLVCGGYLFGRNGDGAAQADVLLRNAGDVELFVLDLESDGGNPRMTDDQARAFIRRVQSAGKRCGLYHSMSGFPSLGQDWNWVAYWTSTAPSVTWSIWQWQGSPLDRNYFNGTRDELYAWAGLGPPESSTGPGGSSEMGVIATNPRRTTVRQVTGIPDGAYRRCFNDRGELYPVPTDLRDVYCLVDINPPFTAKGGNEAVTFSGAMFVVWGNELTYIYPRDVNLVSGDTEDATAAYNEGVRAVKAAANAVPEKV